MVELVYKFNEKSYRECLKRCVIQFFCPQTYALIEKHHTTCRGLYGSCVNYTVLERVSNSSGDTRTFPCTAKGWKCETNLARI